MGLVSKGGRATGAVAALLLLLHLLGAALATVPGKPTVMDIRAGLGARLLASASQVGAQDGYNEYGVEEQEVCLQEVNRRDCHIHGVDGGACGPKPPKPSNGQSSQNPVCDAVTSFWTSELTCCNDKHDYNYGHGSATVGDHLWGNAGGTIGTCDWVMHYVDDDLRLVNSDDRVPGIQVTNNIFKLGSANAICYFGADSHECGGPLCERMVMALDGFVYFAKQVYSYWGETDTSPNTDRDGDECDAVDRLFGINLDRKAPGESTKAAPVNSNMHAVDGDTESAPAKPAGAAAASDASAQYYEGGGHYDSRPVYSGQAVVINGIVSSMAGPRKHGWDSGVFEFVVAYTARRDRGAVVTAVDPNIPYVQDKTYKLTFYKQAQY